MFGNFQIQVFVLNVRELVFRLLRSNIVMDLSVYDKLKRSSCFNFRVYINGHVKVINIFAIDTNISTCFMDTS